MTTTETVAQSASNTPSGDPEREMLVFGPTLVLPCWKVGPGTSGRFGFDPAKQMFTVFASDISYTGRLIALRSAKTGAIRVFDRPRAQMNDGDVWAWDLTGEGGLTLRVFNT